MSKEDSEICDVSRYLSQMTFENLSYEIDYGIPFEIGHDFYEAMCRDGLRRWLPGKAKVAAGECLVATMHHDFAADVISKPDDYGWNFRLSTAWTPELELTKHAFRELDDEYYYDVCIVASIEEMMAAARQSALTDAYKNFMDDGWVPTLEIIRQACEAVLQVLKTDDGKLLNRVTELLERDQQISAGAVRHLIEQTANTAVDSN